ncbi:MAG: enoyl-CoA hydratase/isomerase family protein [Elusimicrobia bacterium]|nr:enoyl-CoA hydratase/isomerase family protein [Elusimicrobiota bacterium]
MPETKTETAVEAELLVEQDGAVLTLTLNRPKVLNALTHGMMEGLLAALKKAEKDPSVRVVVLTGAGRAFCAGADLEDLKKGYREGVVPSLGGQLRRWFNPMIAQLRRMEKPVVGAVNGLAAGAGASLILAADVKICAPTAKFIAAFGAVGLAPDSGFTHMLVRAMGRSVALEHAWTGKPILATEAERWGLVNKVVPAEELRSEVRTLVDKLLAAAPRALAVTKRSFNRAADADFDAMLEYEAQLQEVLGKTKDHLEGVNAFLEGRAPRFKGE